MKPSAVDGVRSSAAPSQPAEWHRVLPTPRRVQMWTTSGRCGAAAVRVLYQPRRRLARGGHFGGTHPPGHASPATSGAVRRSPDRAGTRPIRRRRRLARSRDRPLAVRPRLRRWQRGDREGGPGRRPRVADRSCDARDAHGQRGRVPSADVAAPQTVRSSPSTRDGSRQASESDRGANARGRVGCGDRACDDGARVCRPWRFRPVEHLADDRSGRARRLGSEPLRVRPAVRPFSLRHPHGARCWARGVRRRRSGTSPSRVPSGGATWSRSEATRVLQESTSRAT